MTAQRSELIRQVADIVDLEPERFDMAFYHQEGDCGTTACIAGHIGLLTGDIYGRSGFMNWFDCQADNIGLDNWAGEFLFTDAKMVNMENRTISQILRRLSKEIETLEDGETLGEADVIRIADEVIAEEKAEAVAA